MSGLVKSLLGMGNPLLDIMAEVDQATLDKYKVRLTAELVAVNVAALSDRPPDQAKKRRSGDGACNTNLDWHPLKTVCVMYV